MLHNILVGRKSQNITANRLSVLHSHRIKNLRGTSLRFDTFNYIAYCGVCRVVHATNKTGSSSDDWI
jgi:hypothetical protein